MAIDLTWKMVPWLIWEVIKWLTRQLGLGLVCGGLLLLCGLIVLSIVMYALRLIDALLNFVL